MSELKKKIDRLKNSIKEFGTKEITIMEVCGTHTMALAKHAIRSLLPENINVISGPGCPVCVTPASEINAALELAKNQSNIICTFGDMIKVPSNGDSLANYKNVKIIYSPLDAVVEASNNPTREIILLGIGFETTTPLIAATIKKAKEIGLLNFSVLTFNKTIPTAMEAILGDNDSKIDGLILPGHVSAITGYGYFNFIKKYNVTGVVAGFEALDVMECLYLLTKHIVNNDPKVLNNYPTVVNKSGNKSAFDMIYEVFEECDSNWRGIGVIPGTGLKIRSDFETFNAYKKFDLTLKDIKDPAGCLCGKILMGKAKPHECAFFKKSCTPSNPIGPCMVSSEGTCAAFFKYN